MIAPVAPSNSLPLSVTFFQQMVSHCVLAALRFGINVSAFRTEDFDGA
jgi:hypothetical protein